MEITNARPEWTSDDVAIFRQFIESPTGRRLVPALAHNAPMLLRKGETNDILIRTGELAGFQDGLQALLNMAYPMSEPAKPEEAFPALENDAAWNDGNQLK